MQIDRSNYEIWLIDWLDGNLDESQVAGLLVFLNENPDIQEEFYEMSTFRVKPADDSFNQKANLKKTPEEIHESQFEYLCIGWLENDLTPLQKEELKEITDNDARKKITFELFQKTKLIPAEIIYRDKKSLIKRTVPSFIIRLSAWGLSAAAVIALVMTFYFSSPRIVSTKTSETSQIAVPEYTAPANREKSVPEQIQNLKRILPLNKAVRNLLAISGKKVLPYGGSFVTATGTKDSAFVLTDTSEILLSRVRVNYALDLKGEAVTGNLIALNKTIAEPQDDENSSNFSRFIARTVRGKILKEKTVKETPLKAYEIAEVGVAGLNKLFGWEMALDEKKDENGRLKSVYFSSRILKFNTPVKNPDPLP
jgi:hypothetical protein